MSVSYETLDKLKKQLQEVKELGMPISTDLYSHLTEVFNRIMLHHPEDGYDKFEEISGCLVNVPSPLFLYQVTSVPASVATTMSL